MQADVPLIHIVDDDRAILSALGRLLGAAGYRVALHPSAEAFIEHAQTEAPGCVIVDLGLPGMDGIALQAALAAEGDTRALIFLSGTGDIPTTVRAIKAGAVDFLTKPVDAAALLPAVAQAVSLDGAARQQRSRHATVQALLARLTPREREVLGHVVAGRLNKQIASALGMAEKTVKVHRGRMMRKLGVRSVADLTRIITLHGG